VIVDTYIDESGTHGSSPHLIMGGLVGKLGQWTYFDKRWGKMLRREEIPFYHTKTMRDTDGPFKGWKNQRKADLVVKAGDNINCSTMFGFSIMLLKAEYLEHYRNNEKTKKVQLDSMYGLCFRYCSIFVTDLVKKTFSNDNLEMRFILESGAANAGDAERIFKDLKKDDAYKNVFKSISFGAKQAFYGLQGADYVSHTAFLAEQKTPDLTDFPAGANLRDAEKILGRKSPVFRCHLHPDLLKFMKGKMMEIDAKRIEFGQRGIDPSAGPAVAAE
jgi:Protein of unknown function (DUF3800)